MFGLSIHHHDLGGKAAGALSGQDRELLDELSSFRGQTLHADGRRPDFRRPDGHFTDLQEYDGRAAHILLRETPRSGDGVPPGRLVGCIRLHRAELHRLGQVESAFGIPRTAAFLAEAGIEREQVLEGGRLIIAPRYQGCGLGGVLLLAAHRYASSIGRRCVWGVAGTSDSQHSTFAAAGYQVVPGPKTFSAEYDDLLRLVFIDLRSVSMATVNDQLKAFFGTSHD